MAARRGLDYLMDGGLLQSAALSPRILRSAIRTHGTPRSRAQRNPPFDLWTKRASSACHVSNYPPSRPPTLLGQLECAKIFDRIVGSSQLGTKALQVPELSEGWGDEDRGLGPVICSSCVEWWESRRTELRRKARTTFPDVFGLTG